MGEDGYFQGILQLRDASKELTEYVEDSCAKEDMVSAVKKRKNGRDYYIKSNTFLNKLARELEKRFKGELKKSYTHHTRDNQHGKNIFRMKVLFKEHDISKGDILEMKGKKYKVMGISKKILLKEEKTGKSIRINFEELATKNAKKKQ